MIKHGNDRRISHSHTEKVRSNSGASTYDLMDYVKRAMRKKSEILVNHADTKESQ